MYYVQSNIPEKRLKILDEKPTVHDSAIIINSKLGSWTDIGPSVNLNEVSVGDYTYFDGYSIAIYADIGKFCSIASHVRINAVNHPVWRVTQHHCTYRKVQYRFDNEDDEVFFKWRSENKVIIGNDVWIGHGSVIMPGVNIGTGAVIGAGAVVTRDIPPYGIAVGVPAKVIKKRFSNEVIDVMLSTKWWDWDRNTLKDRIDDFNSVEDFIEKYYKG